MSYQDQTTIGLAYDSSCPQRVTNTAARRSVEAVIGMWGTVLARILPPIGDQKMVVGPEHTLCSLSTKEIGGF